MRARLTLRTATVILSLASLILSACGGLSLAPTEAYPTRAIEMFTAFTPGGTSDLIGRMTAAWLSKKWNVPINVGNRPGGNTVPANLDLYNAKPDGYTIMMDTVGSSSILPNSVPNLPFNVLDRGFVSTVSSNAMLLVVGADSPLKTLKDVADLAKKDPDNFTWTGIGVAEIPARQLFKDLGIDIARTKSIVWSGTVTPTTLAANGSVKLGINAVGPSLPGIESGLIRAVAIAADKRWPGLPNVPTTAEAGYKTLKVVSWIGISAPPKTPDHIVNKWNQGVQEMLKDPAVIDQITKLASIADYRDPKAFKEQVASEIKEIESLYKK